MNVFRTPDTIAFPSYSESHFTALMDTVDPIEQYEGFLLKRGDTFRLGMLEGSKVRQCLHVVHRNLERIRAHHNNGILTAAGVPSPQSAIVAGVAKYFGLSCAVSVAASCLWKSSLRRSFAFPEPLATVAPGIVRRRF